jgi:hypothetical protein
VSYLSIFFSPLKLGIIMMVWIFSGCGFGLLMAVLCHKWISKSGSFVPYDRAAKLMICMGLVGYILMGVCYQFQFSSFVGHLFLAMFIGIGSIGYYGLTYMSIIETFYPLSSLLIGNLLIVGASFYSALSSALSFVTEFNAFFLQAVVGLLPFLYVAITYRTNFKRYKCYMDEQKYEYVLLKIEDTKSHFNNRKY